MSTKTVLFVRKRHRKTVVYYANDITCQNSNTEIAVNFGRVLLPFFNDPSELPDSIDVPMDVTVILSWDRAESVARILLEQVEKAKAAKDGAGPSLPKPGELLN